ncbi:hypothetical protein CEXT_100771 [Caerostris extrusa]|uniref:Uncharacterized protein n=1 Tax=Caerostris extrusa TaxID=172846 RepID=A0AAV4SAW5_CAEEX|nr:hypothetical protein CEXT_100771 [Caerostris extrusa]
MQWRRVGPIAQRSVDRNHALLQRTGSVLANWKRAGPKTQKFVDQNHPVLQRSLPSRVAKWKRAGPITQMSSDRNHALLAKEVLISDDGLLTLVNVSTCSTQQDAVEGCWAYNPEVRESKPRCTSKSIFYI